MKHTNWIFLFLIVIMQSFAAEITADTPSDSDLFNECDARCGSLTGEGRYRCIKMCINSKKKNAPPSGSRKSSRFDECEDICSSYTGLEQIKCIRMCLDEKRNRETIKKNAIKKDVIDPCEMRCGVLTGTLKDKCLMRCRNQGVDEYKDPQGYKQSGQ
ncbi:MAG: hypothetical protein A2176_01020 [Spirochaetes bacterium RBG_13_51_14]|nr:MAG: hypothetical protein A2176_01020 [Spirochaetes bacterium RBG_13_51_14]